MDDLNKEFGPYPEFEEDGNEMLSEVEKGVEVSFEGVSNTRILRSIGVGLFVVVVINLCMAILNMITGKSSKGAADSASRFNETIRDHNEWLHNSEKEFRENLRKTEDAIQRKFRENASNSKVEEILQELRDLERRDRASMAPLNQEIFAGFKTMREVSDFLDKRKKDRISDISKQCDTDFLHKCIFDAKRSLKIMSEVKGKAPNILEKVENYFKIYKEIQGQISSGNIPQGKTPYQSLASRLFGKNVTEFQSDEFNDLMSDNLGIKDLFIEICEFFNFTNYDKNNVNYSRALPDLGFFIHQVEHTKTNKKLSEHDFFNHYSILDKNDYPSILEIDGLEKRFEKIQSYFTGEQSNIDGLSPEVAQQPHVREFLMVSSAISRQLNVVWTFMKVYHRFKTGHEQISKEYLSYLERTKTDIKDYAEFVKRNSKKAELDAQQKSSIEALVKALSDPKNVIDV